MSVFLKESISQGQRIIHLFCRIWRYLKYIFKRIFQLSIHIHIENRWRLGDEILAIPFYQLFKKQFPKARITVSVNYPELLVNQPGIYVDNACTKFECDLFIFAKDDKRRKPRLMHLCEKFNIRYSPLEPDLLIKTQNKYDHLKIAYSIGAGWICKSWSRHKFENLLFKIHQKYPSADIVELGKGYEPLNVGENFVSKLSVKETIDILKTCHLFIGADSGLVHLALALGVPSIGLYGPVQPFRAFGRRSNLYAVLSTVVCQGCYTMGNMKHPGECPLKITSNNPDDYPCMSAISPEIILDYIEKRQLLKSR